MNGPGIRRIAAVVMAAWFCVVLPAAAKVEVVGFADPAMEALYQQMIRELRCLVCQNQNLADSNADLAKDLRRKTRELVEDGKSRSEVVDYMVSRYGEFVLYRPRFTAATAFLWVSPLVLSLILIWWVLRWRRRATAAPTGYSEDDLKRARALLEESGNNGDRQPPGSAG